MSIAPSRLPSDQTPLPLGEPTSRGFGEIGSGGETRVRSG
jgi:hypothetical protein